MPTTITSLPTRLPGVITQRDLCKGLRVKLTNGWEATLLDNQRNSSARLCKVYGFCTESGSVYAKEITKVQIAGQWLAVRYLPSFADAKRLLSASCPNINIRKMVDGGYRVAVQGQDKSSTHYASNLLDAIDRAKALASVWPVGA